MRVLGRQLQDISMVRFQEPGWQHEDFASQGVKPSLLPRTGQAEPSEPVDQIVSQQNKFEMGGVGRKAGGGDFSQRKAVFEFAQIQLDQGPLVVEAVDGFGLKGQVGDKAMVVEISETPECELNRKFFFGGLGTTDENKAMGQIPGHGVIGNFCDLPSALLAEGAKRKASRQGFQGRGELGDHDVSGIGAVEKLNERAVEEARIGAKPNGDFLAMGVDWKFGAAESEEPRGGDPGMIIPRSEQPVKAVLGTAFETNQRMIRGSPRLVRVVADPRALNGPSVQRKHRRIQIQDKPRRGFWKQSHFLP